MLSIMLLNNGQQLCGQVLTEHKEMNTKKSSNDLPATATFKVTNASATLWRLADALASTLAAVAQLFWDMKG